MIRSLWILFFMTFIFCGCSKWLGPVPAYEHVVRPELETISYDYKPQMVDGVMEPLKFPDLDKNQDTLLGIDSNNDGVRDDLEIYINRALKYDYERETYKVFFRHAQIYLKNAKGMSKDQLKKELNRFYADNECLRYYTVKLNLPTSESRVGSDFALAFNTKERKKMENLMTEALKPGDSITSGVSTADEAFEYCSDYVKKKYPNIQK